MGEKFGERVRRIRKDRKLGLRETAKNVGISATYLSRIETNEEKSPPAEKVILALAKVLDDNVDILMTLAGRVAEEVEKVITADAKMPEVLRTARKQNVSGDEILRWLESKKKGDR